MAEDAIVSQLKRFVVGKPIPSSLAHHERLSRFTGLAVLSSDPLPSVAYATEEILRVLILVGPAALSFANPIAFVIAAILAIVVFSYRQTIHAYPNGGGAYIVAKDNLGDTPALIAAAALLIDYVLTVAVSIAAGVAALTSAFPQWHIRPVEATLAFVVVLMLGNLPSEHETVVSQLARGVFGSRGVPYYAVQAGTMLILVLAANTAYADFPRLASILARDRYLPRQLMNQGDRLAFSNGIVGLSVFAAILLVAFGGDTHALIPLYMIGVFVSFTLSQAGMVMHWRRLRGPRWKTSAAINGVGAFVTGIVLVVVAVTKAHEGAWIILLLIPVHVIFFRATRKHYDEVQAQLSLAGWTPRDRRRNVVLVPISGIHRAVVEALDYAKTLSSDVRAVYVGLDPQATERLKAQWPTWGQGVELVVLDSPYRSLMEPLLEYIETLVAAEPPAYVTVALPEFRAGALVAPSLPQSERASDQGRAALQAEHRRH